jgi:hypothetical protein
MTESWDSVETFPSSFGAVNRNAHNEKGEVVVGPMESGFRTWYCYVVLATSYMA